MRWRWWRRVPAPAPGRGPGRGYPRKVVLRDTRDEAGSRYEAAAIDDDGLHITGQDLGRGVSDFFGAGVSEYEWAWTVPAAHVPELVRVLGGAPDDDVLRLLTAFYQANGSGLSSLLRRPGIDAEFWSRSGD